MFLMVPKSGVGRVRQFNAHLNNKLLLLRCVWKRNLPHEMGLKSIWHMGEKSVCEEPMGEKSAGKKYMGGKSVGEKAAGEKSAGELGVWG